MVNSFTTRASSFKEKLFAAKSHVIRVTDTLPEGIVKVVGERKAKRDYAVTVQHLAELEDTEWAELDMQPAQATALRKVANTLGVELETPTINGDLYARISGEYDETTDFDDSVDSVE